VERERERQRERERKGEDVWLGARETEDSSHAIGGPDAAVRSTNTVSGKRGVPQGTAHIDQVRNAFSKILCIWEENERERDGEANPKFVVAHERWGLEELN